MNIIQSDRSDKLLSDTLGCLREALQSNGSIPNKATEEALRSSIQVMVQMLSGQLSSPVLQLASLDPGSGKTEALCCFLRSWKAQGFTPAHGALIVLSTHKEIESCIERSDLQPCWGP